VPEREPAADGVHLALQDVAHAPDGVDQLWTAALIDLLPEAVDHHVDDVGARVEVIVPGILGDQGAGHDPAGIAGQVFEDRVFLRRKLDGRSPPTHLAAAGVDPQVSDGEDRRRDRLGPAGNGFYPRQQLLEREWLGDVVI